MQFQYLFTFVKFIYVMYKLRFCTSCNLYKKSVQFATGTNSLYKLQLVWIDLYKLQLLQAPYLSVEKCILMNLYFKIYKIIISDLHE